MAAIARLDTDQQRIIVRAKFWLYGELATDEIGQKIVDEIEKQYNEANGKIEIEGIVYGVEFRVSYEIISIQEAEERIKKNRNYAYNFIRIGEKNHAERSFMGFGLGQNVGHWLVSDGLGDSTTVAHEFGHGLGLPHPEEYDMRFLNSAPPIMAPRGTLVKSEYQWNPTVEAGEVGGTMRPHCRKVNSFEIAQIFEGKVFDENNELKIGSLTNLLLDEMGEPIKNIPNLST